jgi:hypothetical protein
MCAVSGVRHHVRNQKGKHWRNEPVVWDKEECRAGQGPSSDCCRHPKRAKLTPALRLHARGPFVSDIGRITMIPSVVCSLSSRRSEFRG